MKTAEQNPTVPPAPAEGPSKREVRHQDSAIKEEIKFSFAEMLEYMGADLKRQQILDGILPEDQTFIRQYIKPLFKPGTIAVLVYRFSHWVHAFKVPVLRHLLLLLCAFLEIFVMVIGGIRIHPYARIGKGFVVRNFSCIFILPEKIGENCTVNQGVNVTNIRGAGRPTIGNNVYLGACCVVMGNIKIGDNAIVAANSLVLNDVPDGCTAMGVPARVLSKEASKSPYLQATL